MNYDDILTLAKQYAVPIVRTKSHSILENLIKKNNPKCILEIGTAIGYSGIIMLKSSSAKLVTIEHKKNYVKLAKGNFKKFKVNKRVKILFGDCHVKIAEMVADNKFKDYFDFIFLDGPKAQYSLLLENLIYLLKPNGTLVVDNVLFRGYTTNEQIAPTKRFKTIIKRLNDFIDMCKNYKELYDVKLIDTEDGILYAKKISK